MSRTWCDRLAFGFATLAIEFIVGDPDSARADVVRDGHRSIQVNVDVHGRNMLGDAANEPSIAIDPNDPRKMAIGFRHFADPGAFLREAGVAHTRDGGHHWIFPGPLTPGVFGSDPVLDATRDGVFLYLSMSRQELRMFRSSDGGVSWEGPHQVDPGLTDKPWMAVDRTGGPGDGHVYYAWIYLLRRSIDGGLTFGQDIRLSAGVDASTIVVDPRGCVFAGRNRSCNAQFADQEPEFEPLHLPPFQEIEYGVNGGGRVAQEWVVADHGDAPSRGHLYIMKLMYGVRSVQYCKIGVTRSEDGGDTWSDWVGVTDENPVPDYNDKWFPMISVAPNGRVDVVWNDMRHDPARRSSVLYYAYSTDGARTWSRNQPLTPPFDHRVGYPSQSPKLGDYYTMVSDNLGVNIAYAATFNGEQDVYFLRVGPWDCNGNDTPDELDIASGCSIDINANDIPDDCEVPQDADGNGRVNLLDYAAWQNCHGWIDSRLAGRRAGGGRSGVVALSPGKGDAVDADPLCPRFDADANGHADLDDFAVFHEEFTRPQGPVP